MKQTLTILVLAIAFAAFVQRANAVAPEDETIEVRDTVDASELEAPVVPQIPFEALDSMTMRSLEDRYVVVYKGGTCGVYDLQNEENVTPIEYDALMYGFRKELGDEGYTFFRLWKEGKEGVLGISESSNRYVTIQTCNLGKKQNRELLVW